MSNLLAVPWEQSALTYVGSWRVQPSEVLCWFASAVVQISEEWVYDGAGGACGMTWDVCVCDVGDGVCECVGVTISSSSRCGRVKSSGIRGVSRYSAWLVLIDARDGSGDGKCG